MESSSTLDQEADANGFVVAYLSPSKTYNDDARARGPGPPFPDTQWIRAVIDQLTKDQNIDAARVYMTGTSAGGTLSYRVACDLSDKIAAIASVAGVDVVPGCSSARPISVLEVHGTADTAVPYNGNSVLLSTPQVIAKWRKIDRCPPTAQVTTTRGVKYEVWMPCASKTGVELLSVIGGDHGWPRAPTLDTGAAVWRFFSAHPLSQEPVATAKLAGARVLLTPRRRVAVRLTVGQDSTVRLTLVHQRRIVSALTKKVRSGLSSLILPIPTSARPGIYALKAVVTAGSTHLILSRTLRLRR